MPGRDKKPETRTPQEKLLQSAPLTMPVIGMESEFNVWLDEVEIDPKPFWKHPSAFIDRQLLPREKSSLQLPTGGAVYFDRGVIEVVTPVIELAPHSTARVVRNLWEQIGFVRDQLTKWGKSTGHTVRLKAYSTHYNISYEIPEEEQTPTRNEKALALLLAYILPVPVMIAGANRRSTGVGVRPRGGRIEITVDFTPDAGLMIATATLIVGIVRAVMEWPSYDLSMLNEKGIPVIDGVIPGKHTTRKGWLTKDFHYEQSPYTSNIDAPLWRTQFGDVRTLRGIAREVAWHFRHTIRKYSDPFSFRLLFAVLEGRAPSMLELADRPRAYEDVGNLCRWGMVIDELRNFRTALPSAVPAPEAEAQPVEAPRRRSLKSGKAPALPPVRPSRVAASTRLLPVQYLDRRGTSLLPTRVGRDRRGRSERRRHDHTIPFPDRRLTRSAYEQVFLKIVSGGRLRLDGGVYTPVGMRGWFHAVFRNNADGSERLVSIDELLGRMADWV